MEEENLPSVFWIQESSQVTTDQAALRKWNPKLAVGKTATQPKFIPQTPQKCRNGYTRVWEVRGQSGTDNKSSGQINRHRPPSQGPRKHVFLLLEDQRVSSSIKVKVEHKTTQDSTPKESQFLCMLI